MIGEQLGIFPIPQVEAVDTTGSRRRAARVADRPTRQRNRFHRRTPERNHTGFESVTHYGVL